MVRMAGIVIGVRVRGLKPGRARWRRTEKVPNPGTQNRLSLRIARAIRSKAESIVMATFALGWRVVRATASIRSALVMAAPPNGPFRTAGVSRTQAIYEAANLRRNGDRTHARPGPNVHPDH